jgi:hypothetical protein
VPGPGEGAVVAIGFFKQQCDLGVKTREAAKAQDREPTKAGSKPGHTPYYLDESFSDEEGKSKLIKVLERRIT